MVRLILWLGLAAGLGAQVPAGPLPLLPITCTPGQLFVVTSAKAGQQIYVCQANGAWIQFLSLGGSGALLFTGGALDINPAVMPRLAAENSWMALQRLRFGLTLLTAAPQPLCSVDIRGALWYIGGGATKDKLQLCVWTGSTFAWIALY
jgi:hypothetical protein